MKPAPEKAVMSVVTIMNRYTKYEKRCVHMLRVLETDWPIALELVPEVLMHYFPNWEDPMSAGYPALTYALDKYETRKEIGDSDRLRAFLVSFMHSIAAQTLNPAGWIDMESFELNVQNAEKKFPVEVTAFVAQFEKQFLSGREGIGRVWKRICSRTSEVAHV